MADYYLYSEWAHEFDNNHATGGLPMLTLLRLPHDHTGNFSSALGGCEHAGTARTTQ